MLSVSNYIDLLKCDIATQPRACARLQNSQLSRKNITAGEKEEKEIKKRIKTNKTKV